MTAQAFGFPAAFITLGAVATIGLAIWIVGLRMHASTRDERPEGTPSPEGAA